MLREMVDESWIQLLERPYYDPNIDTAGAGRFCGAVEKEAGQHSKNFANGF